MLGIGYFQQVQKGKVEINTSPTTHLNSITMSLDPIMKRIIIAPHVPGVPSAPIRVAAGLGFIGFVSAVIYGKWVEPTKMQERMAKELYAAH